MNYTVEKKLEENWLTIKGRSKTNLICETACLISVAISMMLLFKTVLINIARWADGWIGCC